MRAMLVPLTWMDRPQPLWLGLVALELGCSPPGVPSLEAGEETESETGSTTATTTGSNNGEPLALVSAQFTPNHLGMVLRFSEPVAPPDAVDPSDFRISMSQTSVILYGPLNEYLEQTSYVDINYIIAANTPPYVDYYDVRLDVDDVIEGNLATDLLLLFAEPLDPNACDSITDDFASTLDWGEQPAVEVDVALLIHYSPGATPVLSSDGDALAAIGPEWVEIAPSPYMLVDSYGWPNVDPLIRIPIPCF